MALPNRASRPRVTAPLVRIVLVAVVAGLAVGALACSASLARGSGHLVHAQSPTTVLAPGPHDRHVTVGAGDRGEDLLVQPAGAPSDPVSWSVGPVIEGHPGLACAVMVDLEVADSAVPLVSARFDDPRVAPPGECVGDLDPPVPRSS